MLRPIYETRPTGNAAAATGDAHEYLAFRLGNEEYRIDIEHLMTGTDLALMDDVVH
jgi:hypothetical protein